MQARGSKKVRNMKNKTSRRKTFPKAATVLFAMKCFHVFHSNFFLWFLSG